MTNAPPAGPASRSGRLSLGPDGTGIAYEVAGAGDRTLLTLHGGPGMGHRYLSPLRQLAGPDRTVIFYDQTGSGASDTASRPDAWTVEHFVAEVEGVRTGLGLGDVDLYGHSWGGWLALSYALDHPEHVNSLVLSGASASVAEYLLRVQALRVSLGQEAHRELLRAEAARDFDSPECVAAIRELSARHLLRAWPFDLERSMQELDEFTSAGTLAFGPAYVNMWGPNEFVCDGPLLDWDVSSRLGELTMPTLVLCGLDDEVPLECSRTLADGLADSEFVIFGHSSHLTMWERGAHAYLAVITDFLDRHPPTTRYTR